MATGGASTRTARVIDAPPQALYDAFMDPAKLADWLPPGDMTGIVHAFDGRVGGGYVMSLFYRADDPDERGKTGAREDRVEVRFVELRPPGRIVQAVTFVTDDESLKGEMTMTVTFVAAPGGTEVTLVFDNLPPGLRPEDNDLGARLSLDQLARRFA